MKELKKKRQEQLLREKPPNRIIKTIEDEFNSLQNKDDSDIDTYEDDIDDNVQETTPPESKKSKKKRAEVNLNKVLDNSSEEEETFIRLGKIKIKGMWEVMITIGATIFAVIGAWINFDMTLSRHTEEIKALQIEVTEYKRNNNETISLLQSNIETRLLSLERIVLHLQNELDKYDYRYNQEIRIIQNDLTILKQSTTQSSSEVTQILRDLNRLESRVANLTK